MSLMFYLLLQLPIDKQRAEYINVTHTHHPPATHVVIFNCLFNDGADYQELINNQLGSPPIRQSTVAMEVCLQHTYKSSRFLKSECVRTKP